MQCLADAQCSHGYDFLVLERPVYTRILLQSLPEQSRVVTGRRVTGIAENAEGVRVYLNDGSYEEGDIVVGCDGVHSAVRTAMWQYANQVLPGTISAEEKRCKSSDMVLDTTRPDGTKHCHHATAAWSALRQPFSA